VRIPAVSLLTAWATNVQVELFLALDWQMEPRDKLVSSAHPLDWWRLVGAATFPLLGCVVKRLFGVEFLPSSADAERVASTAGSTVNEERASLSPEKAAKLIFLAHSIKTEHVQ
jgi:hypothetical protein